MNAIEAYKVLYKKHKCESAQAIIFERLSQVGLAPKLYGVFNGGRIEEYIPSECATIDDLKDVDMSLAVMRKLARFHSVDLPLEKRPIRMERIFEAEKFAHELEEPDISQYSPEDQKRIREIFKFECEKELIWINKVISRVSNGLVCTHNDLHQNNILLKHNYNTLDDRVVLIDYDSVCYFYRSYDIASFLRLRRTVIKMNGVKVSLSEENSDESSNLILMQEYLREYLKLNEDKRSDEFNTFDHLQMEVDACDLLFSIFFAIIFKIHRIENTFGIPVNYAYKFVADYESKKQRFLDKYDQNI